MSSLDPHHDVSTLYLDCFLGPSCWQLILSSDCYQFYPYLKT